MKLFFWTKHKAIDRHARLIADELYSRVLPEDATSYIEGAQIKTKKAIKQQKKKLTRVEQVIHDTANNIQEFKRTESLGVYGKARYHLTFMERLNELGYPEDTTKKLNDILLMKSS